MKFYPFLLLALLSLVFACRDNSTDEKKVEQILGDGKDYQDIIRNPVSGEGVQDTDQVGKAFFAERIFDFGEVKEGSIVTHDFLLKNIGKKPIFIQSAVSTCGCTVPEISKEPVLPDSSTIIHVTFDTKGKTGEQEKPVTVLTNGYPAKYVVILKGSVIK